MSTDSAVTRHIFGPVPSRRLGISLGVDIIPFKTCSLDCLYCECGRTNHLTIERRRFTDPAVILAELKAALAAIAHLDFITFSGSGEPTLNSDLGRLIRKIKKLTSIPVAVLTNGTLLYLAEVRHDLLAADLVLPSLDAASMTGFQRLNQPHSGLDIARVIAGLARFRTQYRGQIWLEVFIVAAINDNAAELAALRRAIGRIKPDRVQLNTIDRPPACAEIRAASWETLEKIQRQWHDLPVEIIKRTGSREEIRLFSLNLEHNLLNTIRRRPLTLDDLVVLTGLEKSELQRYLDVLEKEGHIASRISGNKIFYAVGKPD